MANEKGDTNEIYQIYDRIFKRLFSLSNVAIINLINGLFGTNHSLESEVTYLNKEFVNGQSSRRLADVVVNINRKYTYHIEAQMEKDKNIVLRVFEYGFYVAMENREQSDILKFPEPIVIYLSKESNIPSESTMTIDFGKQGSFKYSVENYVYLDHDITEINRKKMVVLIPFQLLHLKKIIAKNPTEENFLRLQELIKDDIIGSIEANLKVGNLVVDDANILVELTNELYEHLYNHYFEIGGCEEMKPLLEGAMELPLDKYRIRIDELEEKNDELEEKNVELEEKLAELQKRINELERKN